MNSIERPRAPRSKFVSVMAWLGIISGAITTLASCAFLAVHPTLARLVGLVSGVITLAAAVGLWRRREWARRGFITVLGYSIVMGFVGALRLPMPSLSDLPAAGGTPPPGVSQAQLDAFAPTLRAILLVGAAVVALVNALIIVKLCTRRVREEFDAEGAA